jgi:hypothetical protein
MNRGPQDLTEVLKYPFLYRRSRADRACPIGENTGGKFDGDVGKFVEQADALAIKDIGNPAQRPSAQDALKELNNL